MLITEVDGYYLPDTRTTSYRTQHTKTTIGIDSIDIEGSYLTYFHNTGHYALSGQDYEGVFYKLTWQRPADEVLPPYAEFRQPSLATEIRFGADRCERRAAAAASASAAGAESDPPVSSGSFPRHMDWLIASLTVSTTMPSLSSASLVPTISFSPIISIGCSRICLADLTAARGRCTPPVRRRQDRSSLKVARIANRGRFDVLRHDFR